MLYFKKKGQIKFETIHLKKKNLKKEKFQIAE